MYRKSKPGKIKFLGFTIVRLPSNCTRAVEKLYRDGWALAVLQKNGNVAITDTGIFDRPENPNVQFKTVKFLHGLGLVDDAVVAEYLQRKEQHEQSCKLARLRSEAEALDYQLVKLPKPKTASKKRVRKIAQNTP